jgi:hypothetical protein
LVIEMAYSITLPGSKRPSPSRSVTVLVLAVRSGALSMVMEVGSSSAGVVGSSVGMSLPKSGLRMHGLVADLGAVGEGVDDLRGEGEGALFTDVDGGDVPSDLASGGVKGAAVLGLDVGEAGVDGVEDGEVAGGVGAVVGEGDGVGDCITRLVDADGAGGADGFGAGGEVSAEITKKPVGSEGFAVEGSSVRAGVGRLAAERVA